MKFEYELDLNDYNKYLIESLRKRYIYIFLFTLFFILLITYLNHIESYEFKSYLTSYIIIAVFLLSFFIIPDFFRIKKYRKVISYNTVYSGKRTAEIKEDGIEIISGIISFYKWNEIKSIGKINKYCYLILKNKSSILLKKDDDFFNRLNESFNNYRFK